ncbi:MAG: septation protein SepH [Terracoccus sp.]
MHDLRFIGVDDLGAHLLLSDDEGIHFRVPLNESLRDAVRRDRPRQGRLPVKVGEGLRPKEVQAMIRAGLTAEEVAERAGWPVEKVHRYEGPILGEREYVAGLARQVRVRPRGATHGTAPTLDARVAERMRSREIEPGTASWDSFRAPSGRWTVIVVFTAGGRQRQAGWDFDQLARTVSATDDEARWLSEDEDGQTPGPIPAPHLQPPASPSQVYDVEAEGGVGAPEKRRRAEPVDLMAAMRERTSQRGRRRRSKATEAPGLDRVPDEALPLEELAMSPADAGDPPPAHERDTRLIDDDTATGGTAPTVRMIDEPLPLDQPVASADAAQVAPPAADVERAEVDLAEHGDADSAPSNPEAPSEHEVEPGAEPAAPSEPEDQGTADDSATVPPAEPEVESAAEPFVPADKAAGASLVDENAAEERGVSKAPSRAPSRKSGRPSVPSWDDIMFGRKTD